MCCCGGCCWISPLCQPQQHVQLIQYRKPFPIFPWWDDDDNDRPVLTAFLHSINKADQSSLIGKYVFFLYLYGSLVWRQLSPAAKTDWYFPYWRYTRYNIGAHSIKIARPESLSRTRSSLDVKFTDMTSSSVALASPNGWLFPQVV